MADRPIIFSGPMVRALLNGRKTQTRRILKPQPPDGARYAGVHYASSEPSSWFFNSPSGPWKVRERYEIGDRLWVRENWSASGTGLWTIADARRRIAPDQRILYAADGGDGKWWPSIHMPREFSRLTLPVSDVRVERLQDITEADAIAEGCAPLAGSTGPNFYGVDAGTALLSAPTARECFARLWGWINGPDAWDRNPWIVANTFDVGRHNIDRTPALRAASVA